MTAQPQLFTCNKCETEDLPLKAIEENTLINYPAADDPAYFQNHLCNGCQEKWNLLVVEFGFESYQPDPDEV